MVLQMSGMSKRREKNEKEILYLLAQAPHFGLYSHNLCHFKGGKRGS